MTRSDALKYIESRIRTDREFAVRSLAEVIIKNCDPAKLDAAVTKWKASAPSNTPILKAPSTTPSKEPKTEVEIDLQDNWGDMG